MRGLLYSALAAYWVACLVWRQKLPERYPVHFGFDGQPDRWASGSFEWFLLPAIGTAAVFLMIGIGYAAHRVPHLWNVPEKKRFVALTPAQRAPIMAELSNILDVTALYTVAVFIVCQWSVYRAATGASHGLPALFHVVVWGGMVLILGYVLRLNGRIKKMILAAGSEGTVGRTS